MPVHIRMETRALEAEPDLTLIECAERLGLTVTSSCQAQGSCHECIVEVTEGADLLTPPTEHERHLGGSFRLACRARVSASSGTIEFRRLRRSGVRILDAGQRIPAFRRAPPFDPALRQDGDTVLLDGEPIARSSAPLHGLALDLGTTTVVLRLVDLGDGRVIATQAFENPQCFAGSDIMARIAYAATDTEARLRNTLSAYVNQAIKSFPCDPRTIYEIAVVGNSTMRDLFFGLDVQPLGQSPYRSVTERQLAAGTLATTSLSAPASALGLLAHSKARAYGLPLVGSHVGADAAACLLAIDATAERRPVALIDIGTNTELLIGNRQKFLAASCPAGPAFEGGGIACGMPAFAGAIERVQIDHRGGASCEVIGGGPPRGICGSGLVDLLGGLLRTTRMSGLGRLHNDRFVLDSQADIYVSEEDISRLAQAKGAHAAGWTLVMRAYGIDYRELARLYLAGGFASHIDAQAAIRIGLIPRLPLERILSVGNAAIEGATLALRSVTLRRELEAFVKKIDHIELETDTGFFDAFVEGCQFRPLRREIAGGTRTRERGSEASR